MSEESVPAFGADDPRIGVGAIAVGGSGPEVRDDPVFEELEAEFRKMESDGPGAVKWRSVAENAVVVLGEKGKDLLVSVWLSYALYREEGVSGLATGLTILRDMIDGHWETLYPPARRERGRVNVIEWLVGRLAPELAEIEPAPDQDAAVIAAADRLDEIDQLLEAKLQKEQVALGELVRALRPHARAARERIAEAGRKAEEAAKAAEANAEQQAEAAPAEAQPSAPETAMPATADASSGNGAAQAAPAQPAPAASAPPAQAPAAVSAVPDVDTGDTSKAIQQLAGVVRKLATELRKANPADPRPYILARTIMWLPFTDLPAETGGKTQLPPPQASRIAALETARSAGAPLDVINQAEGILPIAPLWLDGHFAVYQALSGLGDDHKSAAHAVAGMVAGLCVQLPGIESLSFSNGTPLAGDGARGWIAELVSGDGAAVTAPAADDDPVRQATALAGQGKAQDAIAALAAAARAQASGRDRMRLQLAQARLCVDNGFVTTALSLLEYLEQRTDRIELDAWDPDMAADLAELRLRGLEHQDTRKIIPDEVKRRGLIEAARQALAGVDATAAVRIMR
ncbi:MAG: type VI secretion system protein TssA [Pseudomonadota bacterium]